MCEEKVGRNPEEAGRASLSSSERGKERRLGRKIPRLPLYSPEKVLAR